jgi:5-methylcytosine-specific restriction protein A
MSGGWAGSDRGARLPPDWNAIKARVHRRSGRKCEFPMPHFPGARGFKKCGRYADGGVDHIVRGDDHSMDNLRDSCQRHHGHKSSQEGNTAKAARKALAKRPRTPERHPGEIRRTP